MTNYCKNHVGREAKRRCFFCQSYICPDCQKHFYSHIFCSFYCVVRYLTTQFRRHFVLSPKKRKQPCRINWLYVLLTLLAVSLVGNILQFIFRNQFKSYSTPQKPVVSSPHIVIPETRRIEIIQPKNRTIHKNHMTIVGTGPENGLIVLEHNGGIDETRKIKDGTFEFDVKNLTTGTHKFLLTSLSSAGVADYDSLVVSVVSPVSRELSRDYVRGKTEYKQVALTFDGDFLDNQADSIMAILTRNNTPATFFLTGRFILKYPELVKKLAQEPFVIGNHTRHHPHLTTYAENGKHLTRPEVTREMIQNELLETEKIFKQVTGENMKRIWRAPFGEHNREIRQWASQIGYRQFGWTADYANHLSLDTVDWVADPEAENYYSAAEILERLIFFADTTPYGMNGGIVLMHLGSQRKESQSYKMLDALIDSLDSRQYHFVTVTEMLF